MENSLNYARLQDENDPLKNFRDRFHIPKDKEGNEFHYCKPDSLQAKFFKIAKLSGEGMTSNSSMKQKFLMASLVMEEAISSAQLEGASTTRRVAKQM